MPRGAAFSGSGSEMDVAAPSLPLSGCRPCQALSSAICDPLPVQIAGPQTDAHRQRPPPHLRSNKARGRHTAQHRRTHTHRCMAYGLGGWAACKTDRLDMAKLKTTHTHTQHTWCTFYRVRSLVTTELKNTISIPLSPCVACGKGFGW